MRLRLAIVAYVAIFSVLCCLRWYTGYLGDRDYGIFDQAFWTTVHDHWWLWNTYEGGSHFRIHNSPVFFLLLPVYALVPSVPTMLVMQTMALALGAVAVYLLGKHFLDAKTGVMLGIAYLLYHPLHGVNYDQFNELAFVPAPLLFGFYALYRRRFGWFWVCMALVLACKEDMSFVVFMMGLYAVWVLWREERKVCWHGVACMGFAMVWLWFSLKVVFPHFRGAEWPYFQFYYGDLGSSISQVVVNLLLHPSLLLSRLLQKSAVLVFVELMAPLLFLPLLAPSVLAVVAPTWVVLMLSTFAGTRNTGCRYMAPVVACLFVALVMGLRGRQHLARWVVVATFVFMLALDLTPMRFPFRKVPRVTDHVRVRNAMAAMIPADASVATQADFYSKVSHRVAAYGEYWPGVQYILVDPTGDYKMWYAQAHFGRVLDEMRVRYVVVKEEDGVVLLTSR